MNQASIDYIKNKETQKWVKDIREKIETLSNDLILASFINGITQLENLLNDNPIIKEKELEVHIEGVFEPKIQEIDTKVDIMISSSNDNDFQVPYKIVGIDGNKKIVSDLRVIIKNFPELLKENEYTIILLNSPINEIKEQLIKIFLTEENQIKYNHLMISSEISVDENEVKTTKYKI